MKIAICICTYKRPKGLSRLLKGINQLKFRTFDPALKIVVVDNDSASSAYPVVEQVKEELKWPIIYQVEKRRGIPYARNCAVREAGLVDFLAFIDDDEVPDPYWLDELIRVQQKYSADVVGGKVICKFEGSVPRWIKKGRFFERLDMATGSKIELPILPATGNVMVCTSVFQKLNKPFNEQLALTGGEDTYFFMGLAKKGVKMIWANEAIVYEYVPLSRVTVKWLLLRNYRLGVTSSIITMAYKESLIDIFNKLGKALTRITFGLIIFMPSLITGKHTLIKSLCFISKGFGEITGVFGLKYNEYKNIHGE